MFLQTSFSPVLDGKVISLAVLSVALFVTNTVTIYLAKRELEKIRANSDANTSALVNAANEIKIILEAVKTIASNSASTMGYSAENNLHLKRAVDRLDDVHEQTIILATGQLKQTESSQRVIDSLLSALEDHQR